MMIYSQNYTFNYISIDSMTASIEYWNLNISLDQFKNTSAIITQL